MKWDEQKALSFLSEQGFRPIDKVFELAKHDTPGLSSWGAIDFLCHYCGYVIHRENR